MTRNLSGEGSPPKPVARALPMAVPPPVSTPRESSHQGERTLPSFPLPSLIHSTRRGAAIRHAEGRRRRSASLRLGSRTESSLGIKERRSCCRGGQLQATPSLEADPPGEAGG
ncbi:hypothetical protein SETIT_3G123400v2 [Setaria italica]|uniref:Uncharacterized protein n=1 Tax=Setaria italica TaxID=4555 RepID=K3ZGE9_SETIT|nr:hypothetical protein SETIT_3G123400v2 [Setaria italica]